MNTTVFAEEAAEVDSVGVKEEVELADVDAVGTTLASNTNSEETLKPEDVSEELVSPANAYTPWEVEAEELERRGHTGKNFKVTADDTDGTVVLKDVSNPASWNNVVDKWNNGKTSETDSAKIDAEDFSKSIVAHYEAGSLIETILTGSNKEDTYIINKDNLPVSENKANPDGMKTGYRTYDVQKLDDTHFLFIGYGGNAYNDPDNDGDNESSQAFASDGLSKFTPVFAYDGRTIAYDKSGKENSSKGKNERLDVDIALVKYENNTVTKIPGVTVASVKVGKDAKNATVSGESILTKTTENMKNVYTVISDKQPSFTIKAKIDGKQSEAKALKKEINKVLKSDDCKYTFEIAQRVVDIDGNSYNFSKTYNTENGTVSASKAVAEGKNGVTYFANADRDNFDFDGFNISKVLVDKKKANLVLKANLYKNGEYKSTASIKLKAGTDYELEAGSLNGTSVLALNFKDKGNFIYRNSATVGLAGSGYKWAFRATPSTDKKDKKKFRIGYYKNTNDGFCYSVEE